MQPGFSCPLFLARRPLMDVKGPKLVSTKISMSTSFSWSPEILPWWQCVCARFWFCLGLRNVKCVALKLNWTHLFDLRVWTGYHGSSQATRWVLPTVHGTQPSHFIFSWGHILLVASSCLPIIGTQVHPVPANTNLEAPHTSLLSYSTPCMPGLGIFFWSKVSSSTSAEVDSEEESEPEMIGWLVQIPTVTNLHSWVSLLTSFDAISFMLVASNGHWAPTNLAHLLEALFLLRWIIQVYWL